VPDLRTVKRVLISTYLVLLHGLLAYFLLEKFGLITLMPQNSANTTIAEKRPVNRSSSAQSTNAVIGTPVQSPTNFPVQPSNSTALQIPVAGVSAAQLTDTFDQARSNGRVHDAIDIPAPAGTAVNAAADGTIAKFHDSELGGITIYQLSEDRNFVLYYAHLQRREETLHEGDPVRRGQTIAYVGDTGNAGAGNYHLHFAIWYLTDPKKIWTGENLNPYPLLKSGLPLPVR
jgi:murein DD-endopeptidase MepM/ murein hydrolase activator NlpD